MAITRADVQGAIKVLNASNTKGRREKIKAMLSAEHSLKDVDKILNDLESYPEWMARIDLEAAAVVASPNDPALGAVPVSDPG